ncbi:MAG: M20/M25/M40 family metallo-hydrolase [Clostridiales bacterium]|nr:M20/M25/M40 family metallo-hydrolase [Clostridiales bacterium]
MAKIILLIILLAIILLIVIVLLRAAIMRPTPARNAEVKLDTGEKTQYYGKRLARMVRKETVSNRDDEDKTKFYEFQEILTELFPNVHEICEKHVFDGSLLFKWSGKGEAAPILLMSHQDVVEAAGEWEHDPFSGDIDERGRLWGRGSVDTKCSLFCIFSAVEELIEEGYVPNCDVYIASSCTEEFAGEGASMTASYLKEQGVRLAMLIDEGGMILNEPVGGVKGTYAMIGVLEKGHGDLKFIAKGKGGHASTPGRNTPLVRLGKFMAAVEKKPPFTSKFNSTVEEMFKRLTPNMTFGMKLIFANLWLFKPLLIKLMPAISPAAAAMLHTTIAFTTAKGSDGLNVLPQEAWVTGNLRFIPHQPTDESIAIISEMAKKYDLDTEVIHKDYPCPVVDYRAKPFLMVEKAIGEVYPGIGVVPYAMTGCTDAKFYSDICENCLRFAPLYIDQQQYSSIHGLNENIYIGTLPMGVEFYKKIIRQQ